MPHAEHSPTPDGPSTTQRTVVGLVLVALVLAIGYPLALAAVALTSPQPSYVGQGQLASCPPTPNCVSSLASDDNAYIDPLTYVGSPAIAQSVLETSLQQLPRTIIMQSEEGYVRAESRSRLMRFVDDMEFVFEQDSGIIHVRSAARLGQSDLGVNRARVERLRELFEQQLNQAAS